MAKPLSNDLRLTDGENVLLCNKARAACGDIAETANGPANYSDTLAIFSKVCLNGKAFSSFSDDYEETAYSGIAHFTLMSFFIL